MPNVTGKKSSVPMLPIIKFEGRILPNALQLLIEEMLSLFFGPQVATTSPVRTNQKSHPKHHSAPIFNPTEGEVLAKKRVADGLMSGPSLEHTAEVKLNAKFTFLRCNKPNLPPKKTSTSLHQHQSEVQ